MGGRGRAGRKVNSEDLCDAATSGEQGPSLFCLLSVQCEV